MRILMVVKLDDGALDNACFLLQCYIHIMYVYNIAAICDIGTCCMRCFSVTYDSRTFRFFIIQYFWFCVGEGEYVFVGFCLKYVSLKSKSGFQVSNSY